MHQPQPATYLIWFINIFKLLTCCNIVDSIDFHLFSVVGMSLKKYWFYMWNKMKRTSMNRSWFSVNSFKTIPFKHLSQIWQRFLKICILLNYKKHACRSSKWVRVRFDLSGYYNLYYLVIYRKTTQINEL